MLIKDNFEKSKPQYANFVAKNFYDALVIDGSGHVRGNLFR
jgi:hypothetical protein